MENNKVNLDTKSSEPTPQVTKKIIILKKIVKNTDNTPSIGQKFWIPKSTPGKNNITQDTTLSDKEKQDLHEKFVSHFGPDYKFNTPIEKLPDPDEITRLIRSAPLEIYDPKTTAAEILKILKEIKIIKDLNGIA